MIETLQTGNSWFGERDIAKLGERQVRSLFPCSVAIRTHLQLSSEQMNHSSGVSSLLSVHSSTSNTGKYLILK